MAEYRRVATKMWTDPWVFGLRPDEKLVWLWLITNPHANVAGIYQVAIPYIAFETGVALDRVTAILNRFQADGKILWDPKQGVIWVRKMRDYQATSSPKVQAAIAREVASIPDGPVKRAYLAWYEHGQAPDADTVSPSGDDDRYPTDRVSVGYPELAPDTETDTETETETDTDTETETETRTDTLSAAAAARGGKGGEDPPGWDEVRRAYEADFGPLTPLLVAQIRPAVREHGAQWVVAALRQAVAANKRSWAYARAILDRWRRDGYGTPPPWQKGGGKGGKGATREPDSRTRALEDEIVRELLGGGGDDAAGGVS